jgi:Tfp pilus assembly protein PilF
VWPSGLAALYPLRWSVSSWEVIGSIFVLAVVTAAVFRLINRYPFVFVGWFWFLGVLVPAIGLIQVGDQAMADRYTYIPSIGLFVIAAWGVPALFSRWQSSSLILGAASVIVVLAYGIAAHVQVGYWKTNLALWTRTLSVTTANQRAENSMATELTTRGQYREAIPHFAEAVRIAPSFTEAQFGYAQALAHENLSEQAIAHYRAVIRYDSKFVEAYVNLGNLLLQQGRLDEALDQFRAALRIKPDFGAAHAMLGYVLDEQGKLAEAATAYQEALRIDPNNAEIHSDFGATLVHQGKLQEALQEFSEAVRIRPDYEPARRNLEGLRSTLK